MIRFKRGLAILLSTCMIGSMMPLPVSALESVSGNTVGTESTEQVQENGEAGAGGRNKENKQPGTEEQSSETEKQLGTEEQSSETGEQPGTEEAPSEDEKSSETDHETGSETESETVTDTETEGTAISAIQALIDALPDADSITEESAEEVIAQLDAIDEAKAELTDEKLAQLDLTRYDAAIEKVMELMGMEGAEQPMLAANVATPNYYSWNADKTLDVSKVPAEEINPQVYTMDTKDAVYKITGKNSNRTALRFVISEDCTVILDNTVFTAGLSYQDGKDISDINNVYNGWYLPAHGVFEVAEGKKVTFQLKGTNQIEGKSYQYSGEEKFLGILLNAKATVEFTGSGALQMANTIGQRIHKSYIWQGQSSNVIMTSGTVYCRGFANSALRADNTWTYTPAEAIRFQYNGGWFYNYQDESHESWSNYYTRNRAVGTVYRVEIPVGRYSSGWMKAGSDGTWSAWSDAYGMGTLYAWQDTTDVRDYYVIYNGKYYHYQSKAYTDGSYTTGAVDVTSEKDTIGGFSGTVKGSGKGIANAELTFVREDTDGIAYTGTCTTDSTGQYYVALPPGTYTVKLKFPTGELTYREKFSLSEEKESNKDINVGAVSGTITDQGRNPLSGAWVTVQQGSNVFSTQTDDTGTYTIIPFGFTEASFDIRVTYKTFKAVSGTLTWNHSSGKTWDSSIDTSLDTSEIHIASEEDLLQLAKNVADLSGKTIILDNDIVVSSWGNGFKGIDYTNTAISNLKFQGNGHSISGMTRPLFHTDIDSETSGNTQMLNNCVFEDLHLRGEITISGLDSVGYGALCGILSETDSRIDGCSFEGSIYYKGSLKHSRLGGLVGTLRNGAKISNSCVKLNSLKTNEKVNHIGGICGYIIDASAQNCYTIVEEMEWTGNCTVGVITGENNNGSAINNCYGIIKKATNNIKLCGDGWASQSYLSGDGASTSASGYITMDKVAAAPGTDGALVDQLNNYVKNKSSFKKWTLTANGYPEFQSLNNVSAEDVTVNYDGSPHSIEVNGVPEGATITYSTDGKSYGSNKPSVTDVTTGTTIYYRVQLDTKEQTGSAKVIIKPAEIGITWGTTTFDYDGNVHIPTATATGMVNGDTLELTIATDSGNAINAGTYTARVAEITGTRAGNYKLPSNATQSYTIRPVSLSTAGIAITGADNLVYTGTAQTPGLTVTLGSKTLTEITDYKAVYTNNTNATTQASKAKVTITGTGNYTGTASEEFVIRKAALTVKADNKTIKYGEEPQFIAIYQGFVNGETETTTGVLNGTLAFACDYVKAGSADNSKVGTYAITPSGLTSANYDISFVNGTLKVERATGQVTIDAIGEKTFGDADFVLSVDKHGSDGALTCTSSDEDVLEVDNTGKVTLKKAGTATITVSMAADTNHTAATNSIEITVAKKAAKLQVTSLTYTAGYGDSDIDLGLTTEGESAVTYTTTDDSVATAANGKLHIVGAGDATVTLSMAESTNYLAKDVDITVTVHPAALTVTADNKSTDYGTDAPAFTVKYDGFKNGDTADKAGVLTGTLDFDCNYQKGDATNGKAGTYNIIPKGLTADNYTIDYVKGTLSVGKVASSVSIEEVAEKTYGDATFDLTVTKSGSTAAPEYESSNTSVLTVDETGKVTIKGAGTATVTVKLPGDDNHNSATDNISITVNKKALTVTADNRNITYGDAAPAYSATYDGFVNGETKDTAGVFDGTLTFACDYVKAGSADGSGAGSTGAGNTGAERTDNSNAGTYTITPSGLTSANYEIAFKAGTLTVGRAAGQVSIASVGNKTYGDADFALSVDKHGSDGALTYTSDKPEVLTVDSTGNVKLLKTGTARITVQMAAGTNHTAATNSIDITVAKKAATLQVTKLDYTTTYGDDIDLGLKTEGESAVTYKSTDDAVATAADGKLHIVGVGNATIKLSMEQSTNYLAKDVEITVKVNPAALTITAENKTIEYGTDAPVFTVKYDGFKNTDTADKEGVLSGTLGFDCSYKKGDATNGKAGNYDITPKGLTAKNYMITFAKGILTVKEKAPEPSNDSSDSNNTSTNRENAVHTHTYTSAMTKAPTTTEEGIMTYTCTTCGNVFIQSIAKIASATGTADSGSAGQSSKPSGRNNTGNNKNNSSKNTDSQNNSDIETKPYIKDDSGKEGWDVISSQLDKAKSGDTVTVAMNGTTVVPKDIFDSIKGEDVTLVLDMENGLSWKINGQDITEPSGDIDFGVTVGADAGKSIPVDVINNVTGERYSMNLTLAYDGEFGFTATLTVNMESKNAGLYANLFYYNEQTGELEFVSARQIDADGNAELEFTHASDYTIVIDAAVMDGGNKDSIDITKDNGNAEDNTTIPASNADHAKSDAWNPAIIIIIGICILLIVFGVVISARKKSGSEEE